MNGAAAGAGAAAAAARVAHAIKASGSIVGMDPAAWAELVARTQRPLVVHASSRVFRVSHHYLTSYRGLTFHTRSPSPIELPADSEVVEAQRIWTP